MKSTLLLYLSLFFFGVSSIFNEIQAQDFHFTNNSILETHFNPGLTGAYEGNMRVGMIYRDQYRFNISQPFASAGLIIDSPLMYGLNKQHWIGVGMTVIYDNAGGSPQTWTSIAPSLAYHIGLDKKFRNVFTLGLQYGLLNRSYDENKAIWGDYISTGSTQDQDLLRDLNISYQDLNAGALFTSKSKKGGMTRIGISLHHILKPSLRFNDGQQSEIPMKINGFLQLRIPSSKQLTWEPSIWASFTTGASNIMAQMRGEYYLKKGGNFGLIGGLGYRVGDSAQLLLGALYGEWKFVLSYDQGLNDFAGQAFELGATRRFIFNRKPEVKPIIFCPRL